MVAAATTVAFGMNAQDASVETQAIGVVIDAHALVDVVDDEIVFDFSSDDPVEAGDAFVLGANKQSSTFLNYSLMLSNAGMADGSISVRIANMNEGMSLSLLADGNQPAGLPANQYGTLGNVTPAFDATAGATHNETNQFLTTAIYGHSGTAPQNGIPVTVQISLSQSEYRNLNAHLHLFNLTYQCL